MEKKFIYLIIFLITVISTSAYYECDTYSEGYNYDISCPEPWDDNGAVCYDSDGNNSWSERGFTTFILDNYYKTPRWDICVDSNTVREFYCPSQCDITNESLDGSETPGDGTVYYPNKYWGPPGPPCVEYECEHACIYGMCTEDEVGVHISEDFTYVWYDEETQQGEIRLSCTAVTMSNLDYMTMGLYLYDDEDLPIGDMNFQILYKDCNLSSRCRIEGIVSANDIEDFWIAVVEGKFEVDCYAASFSSEYYGEDLFEITPSDNDHLTYVPPIVKVDLMPLGPDYAALDIEAIPTRNALFALEYEITKDNTPYISEVVYCPPDNCRFSRILEGSGNWKVTVKSYDNKGKGSTTIKTANNVVVSE